MGLATYRDYTFPAQVSEALPSDGEPESVGVPTTLRLDDQSVRAGGQRHRKTPRAIANVDSLINDFLVLGIINHDPNRTLCAVAGHGYPSADPRAIIRRRDTEDALGAFVGKLRTARNAERSRVLIAATCGLDQQRVRSISEIGGVAPATVTNRQRVAHDAILPAIEDFDLHRVFFRRTRELDATLTELSAVGRLIDREQTLSALVAVAQARVDRELVCIGVTAALAFDNSAN